MGIKIQPCVPDLLPLKKLKMAAFAKELQKAHEALALWNEKVKKSHHSWKEKIVRQEVQASVHVQSLRKNYAAALNQFKHYKGPLTLRFLCDLHRCIKRNTGADPQDVGRIRNRQNWIGPQGKGIEEAYFYPPPVVVMKKSLKNLLAYGNSKQDDPLVQLAVFFGQLLLIHPFMDGNGRVARALIPYFLCRKKATVEPLFCLSAYFKRRRLEYFYRLYLISKKKSWVGWIRFFLQGVTWKSRSETKNG